MSYLKVKDVRLSDSPADKAVYEVVEGGTCTYVKVSAQGNSNSVQQSTFNLQNTASDTGRNAKMYISAQGTLTLTGTNFVLNQIKSGSFGWKPFPLNRNINTIQHVIGSASETLSTYQIIDIINNLDFDAEMSNYYNNSQPDFFSDYTVLNGTTLSPIADYSTSAPQGMGVYKPRTSGITNITVTGGTTMVITFDLIEPLITPFSILSNRDKSSLYHIQGETITINWMNALADMYAICPTLLNTAGNATITGAVVAFANSPLVHVQYVTCPKPQDLSKQSIYRYPKYQIQPVAIACANTATGGTPTTLPGVNITASYSIIPDLLIFVARQNPSSRNVAAGNTSSRPDRFLQLSNPNISINNSPSVFNNISLRQMYDISRRNGYTGNYENFACLDLSNMGAGLGTIIGSGTIFCVSPALDLGICQRGITNNSNIPYTIAATFDVANYQVNTAPIPAMDNVVLNIITVNFGELVRDGENYVTRLVEYNKDESEALLRSDSKDAEYIQSNNKDVAMRTGGSFLGDFWTGFKKPFQWAWDNKKEIADAAKAAAPLVGLGMKKKEKSKSKTVKLMTYRK